MRDFKQESIRRYLVLTSAGAGAPADKVSPYFPPWRAEKRGFGHGEAAFLSETRRLFLSRPRSGCMLK